MNKINLISRETAKNYIDSQKGRPFIGCIIGEVMKMMLDEVPSAEPERKWIPVSEALPKDMDRILATIVRSDGEKRVRSGHYYKGLFMMDNGDTWNEMDKEVLAWMPLVEPYKEGE